MLIMQISTQADRHEHRKTVVIKKVPFIKMDLKFQNPKFNILCKITFIFLQNGYHVMFRGQYNKVILEQVKMTE